ncbi:flavin reductase family protein [Desertibacillus haloalkaliphilus]|uniref:flavin reductase family protein n=1 Tax=Desertibacillus haloalkaliphilus TaxID=1328930 RepID=UPI001C26B955|nr:flavin reductase family protein [Desertibacillus haloalkaliphilus]MBU8907445.1 flavin reductase family protein [Desertibacillus haloalkaliphilus]
MIIDPKQLSRKDNYKLLIGSVLPRPIAFVTSQSTTGVLNAAPFSFYNVVTADPPLISVSVGRKPNGVQKDTSLNICNQQEFVVHVVDEGNVEQVNASSADFPHDVSEVEEIGLTKIPSHKVGVPSIKEAKIKLECRLHKVIPLGGSEEAPHADLIIGEVVCFDIDDSVYEDGKISTDALAPLSRLAGTDYGKLGERFSKPRPTYNKDK